MLVTLSAGSVWVIASMSCLNGTPLFINCWAITVKYCKETLVVGGTPEVLFAQTTDNTSDIPLLIVLLVAERAFVFKIKLCNKEALVCWWCWCIILSRNSLWRKNCDKYKAETFVKTLNMHRIAMRNNRLGIITTSEVCKSMQTRRRLSHRVTVSLGTPWTRLGSDCSDMYSHGKP